MNIIIFNHSHPSYSSGNVGLDLFNELKARGHAVKLLVNVYDPAYPDGIISIESLYLFWKKKIKDKLKRVLKLGTKIVTDPKYHFHELREKKKIYKTKTLLKKARINPDAIILLFIKDFINAKNIYELNKRTHAPIFWLMYDMGPFTGGCHYAWDCKGYQNNCGNCPGLYSSNPFDLTYENLLFKRNYLAKTNIHILAASEWQYRQSKSSSLFREKYIHKILLSINPSVFKRIDKQDIRLKLGIPSGGKIIFFGSMALTYERKGMLYLIESLKILKDEIRNAKPDLNDDILLLIAGEKIEDIADILPFKYHYLGVVDNTYGIATAFQAADVFVCPSIEDSGPMMINQSIMAGTPVVSFEMGVALDLVITGRTGYRAKIKDISDFAHGIYSILSLDSNSYNILSQNCTQLALNLYSPKIQIDKIENILIDSQNR